MKRRRLGRSGLVVSEIGLAVAWTLCHDYVGATLVGATSVAQLDESLAAAEMTLSPEVLAACDRISRDIRYPME